MLRANQSSTLPFATLRFMYWRKHAPDLPRKWLDKKGVYTSGEFEQLFQEHAFNFK